MIISKLEHSLIFHENDINKLKKQKENKNNFVENEIVKTSIFLPSFENNNMDDIPS